VEAKRGLWCSTSFESVQLFLGLIANGGVAGKGGGEKRMVEELALLEVEVEQEEGNEKEKGEEGWFF